MKGFCFTIDFLPRLLISNLLVKLYIGSHNEGTWCAFWSFSEYLLPKTHLVRAVGSLPGWVCSHRVESIWIKWEDQDLRKPHFRCFLRQAKTRRERDFHFYLSGQRIPGLSHERRDNSINNLKSKYELRAEKLYLV